VPEEDELKPTQGERTMQIELSKRELDIIESALRKLAPMHKGSIKPEIDELGDKIEKAKKEAEQAEQAEKEATLQRIARIFNGS
jgi:hypothetical protein